MKSVKIKNVIAMVYTTQFLSGMAMLNATFNIQAEAGWLTGRACQLFENLKLNCNPNNKLLRAKMIKKLNEIKPEKGEDHKVTCDRFEGLKVKYQDQAEILDNGTIVMHFFWCMPNCTNQN